MSIIPDPDELMVCPYDPVHRVAAKKFPYHLNKCRKQYGKAGEYKSCPFNARHVIPAPEYQYHIETCESKAAIEMEIAFEQSRNDTTGVIKGCTDIPKTPIWSKPELTENWDDEEEVAPVFKPQGLQNKPPENLPRPLPSRPMSRRSDDISPSKSFPPPGEKKAVRNFQSSRPSRGRQMSNITRGDEHLLSTVRPNFNPSPISDELLDQDEFPPLVSDPQPRHSDRRHEPKLEVRSESEKPFPISQRSTQGSDWPQPHSTFTPLTQPTTMLPPTQPSGTAQTLSGFTNYIQPISPQTRLTDQDQAPDVSPFEQLATPAPSQYSNISRDTAELPTLQANSQSRPSLQNIPVFQPSFVHTMPTLPPTSSYPPRQDRTLPTASLPVPPHSFSQPPPAPLNGTQGYSYNLQQYQAPPTQQYLAPQQDYLNTGMHVPHQVTQAVQPTVQNSMPPQQILYNQPQYQPAPNPYSHQAYPPPHPPAPQYSSFPPGQHHAPQYAPQQYYQNAPQYNAAIPDYQCTQAPPHAHAPGQIRPNPPYQPLYSESIVGSQVSAQRPPGPGLIGEKNPNLNQATQNIPPAVSNGAYLSANSVPIKLAPLAPPAPQYLPQNATQGDLTPSIDQSSIVSMGFQSPGTGRGRGRGLSPRASPKRSDHVSPSNPTHQPPPSLNSLAPQMEQLHLAAPPGYAPQQQPSYLYQQNVSPIPVPQERDATQFPQPPRHSFYSSQSEQTQSPLPPPANLLFHPPQTLVQQHSGNPPPRHLATNHIYNPSLRGSAPTQNPQTRLPPHFAPQAAQPRASIPKLMYIKDSLANIEILEQKMESQALTEEEKELVKTKRQFLEELKDM